MITIGIHNILVVKAIFLNNLILGAPVMSFC